ncbi:MAG: type II toxin-antitoxin system VapC family toxin [Planctomycetota bacterium]|jgi:predicted nucleic acid-binding protein
MRDFLIDTNIWAYWFNAEKYPEQHANIRKRLQRLPPGVRIGISPITWGEIAVGLSGNSEGESSVQLEHLQFVRGKKPWLVDIGTDTAEEYGRLRGRLRTNALKRNTRFNAKELVDRLTWLELGSLENDLWIVAQAVTRDLILVTNDKLERISEVAGDDLHTQNWAE